MDSTNGKIITKKDGVTTEDILFTYSEEEKQQQEIATTMASLVFQPEFIPFYPRIKKEYKLTITETHLYGFIRFYMANGAKRFYFTNEQLADALDCYTDTISDAIGNLVKKNLITCSYRIKANGGKMRFITNVIIPDQTRLGEKGESDSGKPPSRSREKPPMNNNKINNNTKVLIETAVSMVPQEDISLTGNGSSKETGKTWGKEELNEGMALLKSLFPNASKMQLNRFALHRLLRKQPKERVFKALRFAHSMQEEAYCPVITDYLDLDHKWDKLEVFGKKHLKEKKEVNSQGFSSEFSNHPILYADPKNDPKNKVV